MEPTNDEKTIQAVVEKAWQDPAFKRNLLENPVATMEAFLGRGLNLPEGKKLAVVDQTDAATVFINIPAPEADVEDVELNEEQLDAVSGGNGKRIRSNRPNNSENNILGG